MNKTETNSLLSSRMNTSTEEIWTQAKETLQSMVNPDLFNLWFDPIQLVSIEKSKATLVAPNEFCAVWLKDNYKEILQDVLSHITSSKLTVKFEISSDTDAKQLPSKSVNVEANKKTPKAAQSKSSSTASRVKNNDSAEKLFNPKNTLLHNINNLITSNILEIKEIVNFIKENTKRGICSLKNE